ncbi:nitrogen permease regulator 3 [Monosporozyma servazzii]
MMSEYLPNSYLLGVHLTISTHSGPLMVYSYPPAKIDAIETFTSTYAMTTNKKYANTKSSQPKKNKANQVVNRYRDKRRNGNQITPTSEFRLDFDSSIRSRTSLRTVSSQSSLSSVSSSSSGETKSWLSSEGLSESELSTDYVDESLSSESSVTSINNNYNYNSNSNDYSGDNASLSFTNDYDASETDDNLTTGNSAITGDQLLKLFDKKDDSDDNRNNQINDNDSYNGDDDDENENEKENITESSVNEVFFTEENFQDIDKIFGFNSEFVAEFCCPDRELCNTKFEFTIDQLAFLGLPIHSDSKGKWRKSKHKKHHSSKKSASGSSLDPRSRKGTSHSSSSKNIKDKTSKLSGSDALYELRDSLDLTNVENDKNDGDIEIHHLNKSMNMFHVCFVLNPPLVEYNERIDDMYQQVVAKFSLLLKFLQSKSNYVSDECEIIMRERENVMKNSTIYQSLRTPAEKCKYLYEKILSKSTLAESLTKCVDQIHKNEIACINLNGRMVSLQIPRQNEFQHLPDYKINPILNNSYLSTVTNNNFLKKSGNAFTIKTKTQAQSQLNQDEIDNDFLDTDEDILNYALLLLDEPQNILKNLQNSAHSSNTNDVNRIILEQIVKNVQPTTPLNTYHHIIIETLQVEGNYIASEILRSCALHLIYWRHARVIIPLSSKNTYIVSPLTSLNVSYAKDEDVFREKFSSLPSLSYFLNKLSHVEDGETNTKSLHLNRLAPKPFGSLIPSKEHKGVYLNVLSWLLRHGYICQMLTFVFIRIDKRIKIAVDEDLENEGFKKKREKILNRKRMATAKARDAAMQSSQQFEKHINAMENLEQEYKDDLLNIKGRERNSVEDHFEFDDPDLQQDYTIILEPERVTALEKRWLYKCISDQPPDIQILFKKLLKYFNGRIPIEIVMLREAISRHEIKKLFNALDKYLVETHHW